MNHKIFATLLCASALGLTACGEPETLDNTSVREAQQLAPSKLIELENPPPPVDHQLAESPTNTTVPSTVEGITAAAAAVESARPEFFATINELPSQPTRNGMPRFISPKLQDADAGVVLAARILTEAGNDAATRSALADALGRTAGDFGTMSVAIYGQETDASVRRTLIMSLKRASTESATAGLTLGLADADALVRADAAYCAASHPQATSLLMPLRAGLDDSSAVTRAAAARALGVLKDVESADKILGMIGDADAEIRLQALRAVKRIDTSLLAKVDLAGLSQDSDARIAREAEKLSRTAR